MIAHVIVLLCPIESSNIYDISPLKSLELKSTETNEFDVEIAFDKNLNPAYPKRLFFSSRTENYLFCFRILAMTFALDIENPCSFSLSFQ